uniref:Ubiquitin-like protease family profile domain-containing protein n=1 Tax=Aegilops tauschii subsp. strangulata TaxID=200361 RepID=A0A453FZV7_AEGTS
MLLFPALQKLGAAPHDSHWYVLSLNLKAKRFEVLDSLHEEDSPSLIEHATRYMNAIKKAWLIAYKDSHKQIQDYELVYIDVLKQENGIDCGFFTLMFLELWNGKNNPAFTHDQVPALKKILTLRWLNHTHNKCKQWSHHLFGNNS